ncbi:signal peptidase I [candidate division KSB1 bacterium]|nr:MAG: signal peptidase I [candidate division KSB1 bacterium]
MKSEQNSKRERYSWAWWWREWIKPFIIIISIMAPLRSSIADWYDVPTGSMKPTILEGDRVVVNKLAYDLKLPFTSVRLARWSQPARGETVVFRSPADGVRLVKRVIGISGDTLAMLNNQLFINGKPLEYSPLEPAAISGIPYEERHPYEFLREDLAGKTHAVMLTHGIMSRRTFGQIVVPPGQYFVMGDNRDNSADSRYIGFIPGESIAGEAIAVALSLDRAHWFIPRWQRFFRAL